MSENITAWTEYQIVKAESGDLTLDFVRILARKMPAEKRIGEFKGVG
jgi:hypothetical protein